MRRKLLAVLIMAFAVQPAVALADGPAGSKENGNEVKCGEGTVTPAGKVYMGANGFELCSDDNTNPDGRIIVAFDKQYMSVDGDKSNGDSDGFVRLDSTGPTCGDDKHTDSSAGPGSSCTASMSRPGGLPADLAGLSLGIMHLVG